MEKACFTVRENRLLSGAVWQMQLHGNTCAITAPGQFVNVALNGFYLRRPISVCDWAADELTILYKVVGRGTAYMATLETDDRVDILTGLGNGYDTSISGDAPLLIGGGVGIPPLYALAKKFAAEGKDITVILGFRSKRETFLLGEFKALAPKGVKTIITTEDGTLGTKGFVTDAMQGLAPSHIYTCGPEAMLRAVYDNSTCDGQYSFEERMGCGFGACMGCSCETKYGSKRICKDGPVLRREEIVW